MSDCTITDLLRDLLFVGLGAYAVVLGIMAWRRPNSPFVQDQIVEQYPAEQEADPISRFFGWTREKAGPTNLTVSRILGPLSGSIFIIVGCYLTFTWFGCRHIVPLDFGPLVGPLELRFWFPMIPFTAFACVIAWMNTWKKPLVTRVTTIFLTIIWGLAVGELVAFQKGIQADRWGAMVALVTVLTVLINFVLPSGVTAVAGDPASNRQQTQLESASRRDAAS